MRQVRACEQFLRRHFPPSLARDGRKEGHSDRIPCPSQGTQARELLTARRENDVQRHPRAPAVIAAYRQRTAGFETGPLPATRWGEAVPDRSAAGCQTLSE